ncbi:MAG: response regulator [bacterium]|nr:response regulator [bacterium]
MDRKYSILIMDDDEDFVKFLETVLGLRGHNVHGYTSVKEFFNALRIEPPDVAIVDMIIHEMPGWQICKKIRSKGFDDVKIIAISGILESEDMGRMSLEADAFFRKPIENEKIDEFEELLDELINKK